MAPDARAIILYDGVCGLCQRGVQFVLPRDTGNRFRFAALQSELGQAILRRHGKQVGALDTFYLVQGAEGAGERLVARGRAGLSVLAELRFPWPILGLLRVLPDFLLDLGYDFVARRRYAWFGKTDACLLPKPEWREKFIA